MEPFFALLPFKAFENSPSTELHGRILAADSLSDSQPSPSSGEDMGGGPMTWQQQNAPQGDGSLSSAEIVAICMAAVGIFCFVAAMGLYIWWHQRRRADEDGDPVGLAERGLSALLRRKSSTPASPFTDKVTCVGCLPSNGIASLRIIPHVEYAELDSATKGFSASCMIGEGGFGKVYKGRLSNGMDVAVKRLNKSSREAHAEYKVEVELMSFLQSPYMVALLGQCDERGERILIYELMENGSLESHLHGSSRRLRLSWSMRMKVALDAARGLEYLHSLEPPVVHRDFKSSNILLDKKVNAKVSDFGGVLRLAPSAASGESQPVLGTFGYLAPEYIMTGLLTEKSDVYSFGVVLLELITGRKAVDTTLPPREQSLVAWASPYLTKKEELLSVIDPQLKKEGINPKHLWQAAAISHLCCQPQPEFRPLMADVVYSLRPLVLKRLGGDLLDHHKHLSIDQELRVPSPKSPPSAPSGELYELYDWRRPSLKLTLDID